jgi:hypothetical protein
MSFEAFATGFFGTGAEIIGRRKDQAENYFEQQMERARTHGMNNLTQRRQRRDQLESTALQLRQNAQMPEEIVRALVSEGPEALQAALRIYSDSANANVPLSEEFWRSVYPTAQEMAIDTNTPLAQFLDQVTGLYSSNLEATQETGGDPFSAFMSSALGLNAMDRARSRLRETQIGGGYSAADLLALESRPQHERAFSSSGFGPNLQAIAAARAEVGTPITQAQIRSYTNEFTRGWEDAATAYRQSRIAQSDPITMEEAREAVRESFTRDFAANTGLPDAQLRRIPVIWNNLPESVREVVEQAASPSQTVTEQVPEEISDGGVTLTLAETLPDGRVVYQTPDGRRTPPMSPEVARRHSPTTVVETPTVPLPPSRQPLVTRPAQETPQETETPSHTYSQWQRMSRSERRAAGLPTNQVAAQAYFRRFREGLRLPEVLTRDQVAERSAQDVGIPTDPVEGAPPSQIRHEGEVLTISRYDPASDSWVYVSQDTGRETFIPVGSPVVPN